MADSSRFSASTGLEMVEEYLRILERRLNQAIAAHSMIVFMASNYAEGGGSTGPEMRTFKTSQKLYDLARDGYDGELNPNEWPAEEPE